MKVIKKAITFTIIVGMTAMLTGCSLKESTQKLFSTFTGAEEVVEQTEGEPKEETKDPLDVYSDVVTATFDQSNEMLTRFNNALDMLYAGEATEEEFGLILADIIPDSNKVIANLDTVLYDIDTSFYDFHRKLIGLVNFQHQMFLKSLESANAPDISVDKDKVREEYVKIKNEQTVLIQEIKQLFTDIMTATENQEEK